MDTPLLWHIPLSHFNEKARWALDYKGIAHRRQVLGPDYLVRAWRATGQGKLPILFLDGPAASGWWGMCRRATGRPSLSWPRCAGVACERRRPSTAP